MKLIDRQYLITPFYGARKMAIYLKSQGHQVNRKRVRRLMRLMGLKAIYRRPRTSNPASGNKIYPYLLNGVAITRPNQVWAADITYIPMQHGFLYLVAIIDWYSRYVLSWRLSNTLDTDFCVEALQEAFEHGKPEIFNPTRAVNLRPQYLLVNWSRKISRSVWTAKAVIMIISSSNGYGGQ
jgi:putative transposase